MSGDGGFLARWSRRKAHDRDGVGNDASAAPVPETPPPMSRATPPDGGRGSGDVSADGLPPTGARAPGVPPSADRPTAGARPGPPAGVPATAAPAPVDGRRSSAVLPPPTLADVALLTRTSDYSRFVGAGVDRAVSNAAMRKLFADPRFNVMDGLDTYIDDYHRADPIAPSMLRRLYQSEALGLFAAEREEAAAASPAGARARVDRDGAEDSGAAAPGRADAARAGTADDTCAAAGTAVPSRAGIPHGASPPGRATVADHSPLRSSPPSDPAAASRPDDDDPDLRLQPDDAARRPGAAPGARS